MEAADDVVSDDCNVVAVAGGAVAVVAVAAEIVVDFDGNFDAAAADVAVVAVAVGVAVVLDEWQLLEWNELAHVEVVPREAGLEKTDSQTVAIAVFH